MTLFYFYFVSLETKLTIFVTLKLCEVVLHAVQYNMDMWENTNCEPFIIHGFGLDSASDSVLYVRKARTAVNTTAGPS